MKETLKNVVINPIKSYSNAELMKKDIFSENRNLTGIYRWVNKETGDSYVGSGLDLTKRIRSYYQTAELERNPRYINRALLKYGHDKFRLEILEYCEKDNLVEREQYYLDSLDPVYNILKQAYSLEGFKHDAQTIEHLRERDFSQEHRDNLSKANTGREFTEETIKKLSRSIKDYRKEHPLAPEALENLKEKTTEREGVAVTLINQETGEESSFKTQTDAGIFLGISRQAIKKGLERDSILSKLYKVKRTEKDESGSLAPVTIAQEKEQKSSGSALDDLPQEMPSIYDDVD